MAHDLRSRLKPLLLDVPLAAAVTLAVAAGAGNAARNQVHPYRELDALAYALMITAAVSISLRRITPRTVLTVVVVATSIYAARGYPYGPVSLAPAVAVFTAASVLPLRRAAVWCGVAVATTGAALLVPLRDHAITAQAPSVVAIVAWSSWLVVPWAVGTAVRLRREATARAREEELRDRAYDERLQIAREVHDVVGHGLAVISMQAGVALHVVDKKPEQAAVALEAIRRTSREALDDLRTTLAVFREPDRAELRPAPGLAQLPDVVAALPTQGPKVVVETTGDQRQLPAVVDAAAYRIVQEALTNVLRHAQATRATVRVDHAPGRVVVEVTDDGVGGGAGGVPDRGHGIAGMRERAAGVGGRLEAGPRPGGGWRVRAELPA